MRALFIVLLGLFFTAIILVAGFAMGLLMVHFYNEVMDDYQEDRDKDAVHRD